MALKVVHDGEAPGALRENCCICRTKTNYWYEPKDIALCEHCAKTTKRVALPTKEEWCAKEDAIFKQKNTHWMPMALSDDAIIAMAREAGFYDGREELFWVGTEGLKRFAALVAAKEREPLTDEQSKALMQARRTAMLMTCKARVPECGEFSAIAQDLDWLCESLGIKGGQHGTE